MKIDTISRKNLQSRFHSNVTQVRYMRQSGRKLILNARKLRQKAARLPANHESSIKLLAKANSMTEDGIKLRDFIKGYRGICLALAFLNNTPYGRCEKVPTVPPNKAQIAKYLKSSLPREWWDKAEEIVDHWLKNPVMRMRDFEGSMQASLEVQRTLKALEDARHKLHVQMQRHRGSQRLSDALLSVKLAEDQVRRETAEVAELEAEILEMDEAYRAAVEADRKAAGMDDGPFWGAEGEVV